MASTCFRFAPPSSDSCSAFVQLVSARVSSLSRALRFALAGSPYALARTGDDTQPVLVRRADDPAGMLRDLSLKDIERGVQ